MVELAMTTIEEAEAARYAARVAFDAIERGAREAGRAAADNAVREYRAAHGCADAIKRLHEASAVLTAAQDAAPPHEWEGKRVRRVKSVGPSYRQKMVMVEGVVETRRSTTVFPDNMRYGLPQIGAAFVRLLKSDGTPGVKFERLERGWELVEQEPTP